MNAAASSGDSVFRAMTDDGAFRVVTLRSTQTIQGLLRAQQAFGVTGRHLGDLATGTTLVRETMSPRLRVQGILKRGDGPGYLLGDSHPSGQTRGLVGMKAGAPAFGMDGAVLQIVRSMQDGRVHQGVVGVPDGGDVSQGLMAYMQESEQITTMIVVSTVLEGEQVVAAGGYLVQLLPNVGYGLLAIMTERLNDFVNIDAQILRDGFTPRALCEELLYGMPFTVLEETPLRYGCWCSRTSMMGALASINRSDVQSMVDDGEVLEITCDYCRQEYRVTPPELAGLLESN
jgi:molecular chaperone Hsp33